MIAIDPKAYAQQYAAQFTQQGKEYVLNEASAATGLSVFDITKIASQISDGQYGQALLTADLAVISAFATPAVGAFFGAVIAGVEALWSAETPSPCTIPGCGPTFNLPECPQGISFTWAWIGTQNGEYVPTISNSYPGTGTVWWGNPAWLVPSATTPGGPGSFEDGLEQAVMAVWDQVVSAPNACAALKAAGLDGNIGYGSTGTGQSLVAAAILSVGSLVAPFVVAWNKTHTSGTIDVPCTQATCLPPAQWINGQCTVAAGQVACTGPAPQRKISYTVVDLAGVDPSNFTDPVAIAFQGLAALARIPVGATISVFVNSGPPTSSSGPGGPMGTVERPGIHDVNVDSSSVAGVASTVAIGAAAVAGAALLGTAIYARIKHKPYKQVWQGIWQHTGGRVHAPHMHMPHIKALGGRK